MMHIAKSPMWAAGRFSQEARLTDYEAISDKGTKHVN
jgi:hypothetical protein